MNSVSRIFKYHLYFSFFCLVLHILLVTVGPHQPLAANSNLHYEIKVMMMMIMKMKANHKQTALKLTASKTGTHVMVCVVTKYGK